MTTRALMWNDHTFEDEVQLLGDIDSLNIPHSIRATRKQAPPVPPRPQKSRHYLSQRVQFLRVSATAETSTGIPGATYPFCPFAPTLLRDPTDEKVLDHSTASVVKERSPLHQLALSTYSRPGAPKMPHGLSMPHSGFQALILCGPGIGLSTFTSVPHDFPKALVNIANRPMVWYVLDWCYRMGVTDITIITPTASESALKSALAQNPYLTTLPSPSPNVLAPKDLDHTTPTAELLRLPEVQRAINTDFMLLPCDLICDVPGETFIESYLISLGGLGAIGNVSDPEVKSASSATIGRHDESSRRRGGLSIWYNTANREESVKHEECDFMCTTKLDVRQPSTLSNLSIDSERVPGVLRNLDWAVPMSELQDECEENKSWKIRQSLLKRRGNVKCLTKYRDSHIYLFPLWVKDFAKQNEEFESVSEDLVGTWAKCGWRKPRYRAKYHARKLFASHQKAQNDSRLANGAIIEDEIDLLSLSSTQTTPTSSTTFETPKKAAQLASRVPADPDDSIISPENDSDSNEDDGDVPAMPPILSYILPSDPNVPIIRRVDTTPLLLSVSLLLAKTPSIEESGSVAQSTSPFAHSAKVAATASIAQKVTISKSDTLIDSNTIIATTSVIKSSVVGSSVSIGTGVRLTNCLIMDGAVIGEKSILNGTVVGKKAIIGKNCNLTNCEIQDANILADKTEGKGEKYLIGGLEDDIDGDGFNSQELEDGEDDGEDISLS